MGQHTQTFPDGSLLIGFVPRRGNKPLLCGYRTYSIADPAFTLRRTAYLAFMVLNQGGTLLPEISSLIVRKNWTVAALASLVRQTPEAAMITMQDIEQASK